MKLDRRGLEKLVREFKAVFPAFRSFTDAGASYQLHEDSWKRSASESAKELLKKSSSVWHRSESFVEALDTVFARGRGLVLTDQFSGIDWNSDKETLFDDR